MILRVSLLTVALTGLAGLAHAQIAANDYAKANADEAKQVQVQRQVHSPQMQTTMTQSPQMVMGQPMAQQPMAQMAPPMQQPMAQMAPPMAPLPEQAQAVTRSGHRAAMKDEYGNLYNERGDRIDRRGNIIVAPGARAAR